MDLTVSHFLEVEQTAELTKIIADYLKASEHQLFFIRKDKSSESSKKIDPTFLALYMVARLQAVEVTAEDLEGFSQSIDVIGSRCRNLQADTQFFVAPPNTTIN